MVDTLLLAFALALIIEGLIPALFPNKWRSYVAKIAQEPAGQIRTFGLIIVAIGLFLFTLAYSS
ncbi:DUF2065 domain-containing protein [Endozoicomonas sp. G2_1]|uniref:DUF2065 domain-containing protein n=1 Tax=Endozoicomonas sp. G2_1 TaxID=2821091 RepID=UPI001ADAD2D7|nr:DUF2065 domain-containing protein [Endozoicomonas sp. G2_1]MBO9491577.1 DUF2065 domain-containing protein [Endozoicomonas sp. G2_1]